MVLFWDAGEKKSRKMRISRNFGAKLAHFVNFVSQILRSERESPPMRGYVKYLAKKATYSCAQKRNSRKMALLGQRHAHFARKMDEKWSFFREKTKRKMVD
jgi:hypothetical protein